MIIVIVNVQSIIVIIYSVLVRFVLYNCKPFVVVVTQSDRKQTFTEFIIWRRDLEWNNAMQ